jgi:transcription-repair coupling factor (superfamily II helicase)
MARQLPPLIVTSARALMHQTLPPDEFTLMEFTTGQRIRLRQIVEQWLELGYQSEDVVEVAGSFSRRGGILDVFPPSSTKPIRIELFGDEIDSLRTFDPTTQRSENRLDSFIVGPASETLPRRSACAATQLSEWNLGNLQQSTKIVFEEDLARLSSGTAFRGIEYYLPFFYNGKSNLSNGTQHTSVLDYLPENTLVFVEDAEELALVVSELESQASTLKQDLINIGDLPTEWPDPYFGWAALGPALASRGPFILGFSKFGDLGINDGSPAARPNPQPNTLIPDQPARDDAEESEIGRPANESRPAAKESPRSELRGSITHSPYLFQGTFVPAPAFGGQVKNVLPQIVARRQQGERVVLVSRQSARLSHLLGEFAPDLPVSPVDG